MEFDDEPELAVEFYYDEYKEEKYFLTINSFRSVEYFHIRKYYLGFEGEFLPTDKGVAFPATLDTTVSLFEALVTVLDESEALHAVLKSSTVGSKLLTTMGGVKGDGSAEV